VPEEIFTIVRYRYPEAGFGAHLVKPVDPAVLTKLLDESGAG
jgi:hypothetical protein